MADVIEVAKSGRATCRTCRSAIEKGALRFGEEVASQFAGGATTFMWHHLPCAAKKKATQLQGALATFEGEVPDRAALEATITENAAKQKPTKLPYVERAATGRSRCGGCHEPIAKGDLRVATERDAEPGGMTMTGPRYFHVKCVESEDLEGFLSDLRTNSKGITDEDWDGIEAALPKPAG